MANLTTGAGKFIDGVLENRGTVNYTGTGLLFGRDGPNLNARIENAAGGTFIVDGEGDFTQNHGSANYRMDNAGTFIKRGAGTTTVVNNPIFFATTGAVQIESGELLLTGSASLGGAIDQTGGSVELGSLSYTLGDGVQLARLSLAGGTVVATSDKVIPIISIRGDGRITLQNGATLTVTDTLTFEAGTLTAGGRLIIAPGAIANLTTGSGSSSMAFWKTAGPSTIPAPASSSDGTWPISAPASRMRRAALSSSTVKATFRKTTAARTIESTTPARSLNAEPARPPRSITRSSSPRPGQSISKPEPSRRRAGSRRMECCAALARWRQTSLTMAQCVRIRCPGGWSSRERSRRQPGRLELTLRGRDATLAHRSLQITGAATFAGALDLALASPFDEPQNSTFAIASYASQTGDFATATGFTGNFGYDFTRAFGAT